jgi:nitrite reductase/ring-hydroxylating ferredoxin subunit
MRSDVEISAPSAPVPDFQVRDGLGPLYDRVVAEILAAVADLKGSDAVERLGGDLRRLHHVIEVGDVGALRDRVIEALRPDLLDLAVRVGRQTLGWSHDFHVDDYLILRVNFPYEVARRATAPAENPGIGRVSPAVRAIAASRRVKDPVYDPQGYHRDHPPPAWAHGPHLDSWAGHSHDGVNIWWAISDVPPQAGMVLYPQLAGTPLACDRRSLYLAAGHPLPPPTFTPLAAGQMLIFNPEVLHGTHLNVTDQTRVAISLRLNAAQPTFDPASFYAREFWRRASDIESGRLDAVLHLKREDHFAPDAPPPVKPPAARQDVRARTRDDGTATIALDPPLALGQRVGVDLGERRVLLTRTASGLRATDANCPHYGLDLMDGGLDGDQLHCPGCALAFDLETGRSACGDLRLKTYGVVETAAGISLDLDVEAPARV